MKRNVRGTLIRPQGLPDSVSHPVVSPLSPSVVYASESPDELDAQYGGEVEGFTYTREGHPNADVVAARIAAMEGAEGGVMTSSGMGAVSGVLLGLLQAGDHAIGGRQLYGRSLRMMSDDLPRFGIETTLVDTGDPEAVRAAIRPETRLVLIEVLSNPTLRLTDIDAIAEICRDAGILLAVDNTFTTPRALRPFDHGADIVIHSVTKLLAGHADVLLGYAAARDPALTEKMNVFAITTGMTASPFDCWLAERGLLTFDLRYDRAEAAAAELADHLSGLPGVTRVVYPGRADHPDRALAERLLRGRNGNMVSFEIEGGRAAANALVRAADGVAFAPTLGDAGTTLSHPASSSHRGMSEEARLASGMTEGFFRVSVGLEDPEALKDVFSRAVAAARPVN